MVTRILTAIFVRRKKPEQPPRSTVTVQQAARALATIVLCESRHRMYGPEDTMARHLLAMRRYGDSPLAFAVRLTGAQEAELIEAMQIEINEYAMSQTVEDGAGWTLDVSRGQQAIRSNVRV
jgi:hypothetical protein